VAYNLSQYNLKLGILEKENDVATGTTKANSAIIHAGYDPKPGTLMAQLNVRGAQLTQEICRKLEVEYQQIGSLVVAFSPEELEKVEGLYRQGIKNGVPRLKLVDAQELHTLEKDISPKAVGALYAPTAAIVDPWDLCLAMAQTAVVNGAQLELNSEVTEIKKTENGFLVRAGGKEYETKIIFNAAGIYADKVHNLVAKPSFTIRPRSGQYYLLDKSQGEKARHIIFQCPVGGTKGVLVAPTVHGNLIVGPDSTPVEGQGTDTTLEGLEFVRERGAKTIPSINFKENIRNFAGLRAAADREDFIIEGAEGAQGFFDLVGIKSPGLSAAAAIGERAVELARGA
ncbi:MAG: NAD(P)/FAD-dependent oxidoreductase, partial [Oscillospiraceae bacterium]